jgi:metal-dependent amidase/aminoacylase/carboxypeptidase family protein
MASTQIVASAQNIGALQTIVSRQMNLIENPVVVPVGKLEGGVRSNIIPEQVQMPGTILALDPEDRRLLHESVRRVSRKRWE